MSIIGKSITRSCHSPVGMRYSPEHKQEMLFDPYGEFDDLRVVDTFTLAIAGPRTFKDVAQLRTELDNIVIKHLNDEITFLSCDTSGLDDRVKEYADENFISSKEFISTEFMDKITQPVGFTYSEFIPKRDILRSKQKRDEAMIRACDRCLLFWHNTDPRVQRIYKLCQRFNKTVQIVTPSAE